MPTAVGERVSACIFLDRNLSVALKIADRCCDLAECVPFVILFCTENIKSRFALASLSDKSCSRVNVSDEVAVRSLDFLIRPSLWASGGVEVSLLGYLD